MVQFSNLLAALGDVPDPLRAKGKRYPLPYLLMFTVLALLSGGRSYRGIITFLEHRREHLNHHFGVNLKRDPAVNTLPTVLQSLDTETLEAVFRRHAKALLPEGTVGEKAVGALDGKTPRGSFDHLNDRKAAQTLTAFGSASTPSGGIPGVTRRAGLPRPSAASDGRGRPPQTALVYILTL